MTARIAALLRGTRRRLAVGLGAVVLVSVLAGCHGTWQDTGPEFWYLDSSRCLDRSNRILMSAVGNKLGGTTGNFVPSGGCQPQNTSGGVLYVQSRLYKEGLGICLYGTVFSNDHNTWFVNREQSGVPHCGSGNYVNYSYHQGRTNSGAVVDSNFFGAGDHL